MTSVLLLLFVVFVDHHRIKSTQINHINWLLLWELGGAFCFFVCGCLLARTLSEWKGPIQFPIKMFFRPIFGLANGRNGCSNESMLLMLCGLMHCLMHLDASSISEASDAPLSSPVRCDPVPATVLPGEVFQQSHHQLKHGAVAPPVAPRSLAVHHYWVPSKSSGYSRTLKSGVETYSLVVGAWFANAW